MATTLKTQHWKQILQDEDLTKKLDLDIFQCFYGFENYTASSKKAGKMLGYGDKAPQAVINAEMGRYAKRIATKFDIDLSVRENQKFKYWDLFFDGDYVGKVFQWTLKSELVKALEELDFTDTYVSPDELSKKEIGEALYEGMKKTITVNSFERNSKARNLCINHYGTKCYVCEFDFGNKYGELGEGYIHVHHKYQIAFAEEEYQVDPINDLIPVCPNCHAMIHKSKPMLSIEELKRIIQNGKK